MYIFISDVYRYLSLSTSIAAYKSNQLSSNCPCYILQVDQDQLNHRRYIDVQFCTAFSHL